MEQWNGLWNEVQKSLSQTFPAPLVNFSQLHSMHGLYDHAVTVLAVSDKNLPAEKSRIEAK